MRAIETSAGALRLAVVDDPEPRPGHAIVRVAAAGVNFLDVRMHRRGSPRLGMEGAGTVEWVDEADPTGIAVGDRVAWAMHPGAYAELTAVPTRLLVPVPESISSVAAAAALLQGLTAHSLTTASYRVRPGDTVLVHAAGGGVGSLIARFCVARQARVLGTVSSELHAEHAREAGVETTFGYAGFAAAARELTAGHGVDAVFDGVNRDTFHGSLDALRRRGTLVLFGETSGRVDPIDPKLLQRHGSLTLTYPGLVDFIADRAELLRRAREVFRLPGNLRVAVHRLADAGRAHAELEERRTVGKLVLTP